MAASDAESVLREVGGVDTLFVNGSVFDGRRHRPGLAVGVRAGRIAAVGAGPQ